MEGEDPVHRGDADRIVFLPHPASFILLSSFVKLAFYTTVNRNVVEYQPFFVERQERGVSKSGPVAALAIALRLTPASAPA